MITNKLNKEQEIEQLRGLLRARRSQQEPDKELVERTAVSLEKFSFLPRYFDCNFNSNTVAAAAVISDKHMKFLAQNIIMLTKLFDRQQIYQSKALCLVLSGAVTLTQETTTGQFRAIRTYNPGDVFGYLDLKYSPVGCQFTIDRKECSKQLEIGCVLLEPGGASEPLESMKEYIESSIRREISILKLNYFFLQGVADDLIGELIFSAASLQYASKQPVFLQYEQSEFLYIVRKGNFCVLWRSEEESKQDNQDFKDIFKDTHNNNILPAPLSCKRWPLRVYEPKDFFGEEDILQNKPRRFDLVCQTAGGYLIALPRLFFIDRLYPQLRSFFEFQASEKEQLYEERIMQVQKQQQNKQSNNQGNNYFNSILNSPTSSSSQSYQHIALSSLLRTRRSSRQASKKNLVENVLQIGNKNDGQSQKESQIKLQKTKGNSYETEMHLSAEESSPKPQDSSSNIPKTLLCSKYLTKVTTKQKQIDFIQSKQSQPYYYEQQQDSPQQHDSIQQQLKLQLSFTIKPQKKSTLDEPRRLETTKNCLSHSLLKLRGHLLETPNKSFSSLEKSFQNENSQYQKFLFSAAAANQTSVSPSIYLNNIQEHIHDRRYSKKANRLNPLSKRQLNRHSTFLDQAIIQKSSSESVASHATNFSGGTVNNNILQGLSASDNGSATNVLAQNAGINGSSSVQQNDNSNEGGAAVVTQSFGCSSILVNQVPQDSQNHDQSYSSIPEPSRFSLVYRKIQEQQQQLGARKIMKKECALLHKSSNLSALSDYSFKLGNYKIKSEILSNSYDNLKKSKSAEKSKKHKFSGDKNVSENKPKYLFATSNNNQQIKYYVNRGLAGNEQQKIPVSLNQPFKDQLKGMILSNIKTVVSADKQSGQFATQRTSLNNNLVIIPNTPETLISAEYQGYMNTINSKPQTSLQQQSITPGICGKNVNKSNYQTDFQDSPCLEESNAPKNSSSTSFNPLVKFFKQNRGIIPQPSSLNHSNTMIIPFLQSSKIQNLKLGGNTASKGQLKQILNRSLGQQPIQIFEKGIQMIDGEHKKE